MENASKALIIAGAILLAILIISLGIMIYTQASGVVDSGAMDEVAVTTFNQKFTQYEGDNVRGAQVNSLINVVIQNNISNKDDASKQIIIKSTNNIVKDTNWTGKVYGDAVEAQTAKSGSAMTGKSYKIKTISNTKSGYIEAVSIDVAP